MALQIVIGFGLIIVSIIIQVLFIEAATTSLRRIFRAQRKRVPGIVASVITLSLVMFWLMISLAMIVFMWAALLKGVNVFESWEQSVYFSLVAFTTLGFGDVILPKEWQLISGFIAADGFLLFGLNTAVFLEVMMRLRDHENDS